MVASIFSFPNPVNEVSARLVAGGVVLIALAAIIFAQPWIFVVLAYGFVARVLTGPTFSLLGQFVTRVLTPALPFDEKLVPGPPKRFAQGIGASLSVGASIAWGFGAHGLALVLVGAIAAAATLESVFAFCLGCVIFNRLMRWGVIPPEVCESCNDISKRWAPSATSAASSAATSAASVASAA
jgi:hypothetical protein